MIFHQFEVRGLAHYSYALGCEQAQELVIVDPKRDVDDYLRFAQDRNCRIRYVLETHIHADYASGARELAARCTAELCLSSYDTGEIFEVSFPHRALREGDLLLVGGLEIKVIHTPGHTPEHISFLVSERESANRKGENSVPQRLLSGDFVFVGSLGRPDLLGEDLKRQLASQLYDSVSNKLESFQNQLQIYPAHGAGSFCGAGMSNQRSTTLGQERSSNRYLQPGITREEFVDSILSGLPPRPSYYLKMKKLNAQGPPLLGARREITALDARAVAALLEKGAVIIDLREQNAFGAGHVPGSLGIGAGPSLAVWASLVVPYDQPLVLIAGDDTMVEEAAISLSRVGLDQVVGYLQRGFGAWQENGLPVEQLEQISPAEVLALSRKNNELRVIDVRAKSEWDAKHIPGAVNIFGGELADHLDALRGHQGSFAVTCGGGYRSTVAASVLKRHGFKNIKNLSGGMSAWNQAGLPTE